MSYDSRHKDWDLQCKVYVGNLIKGVTEGELKDIFLKYGALKNVWVARLPPGFAFVEFEDPRDAEDACKGLDGTKFLGRRIRVEMSHGKSRGPRGGVRRRSRSPPPRRRNRSRSRSRSPRRSSSYDRGGRNRSRSPESRRDYRDRR